jgi:hypothetical protein
MPYFLFMVMLCLFTGIKVPRTWPQKGNIVFEEVSLRYDASRGPVISNLNLHIPAGQKVNNASFRCSMMVATLLWAVGYLLLKETQMRCIL